MSKALDKVVTTLSALTEDDLQVLSVSRRFDHLAPRAYIEKWIECAQKDLVMEAFGISRGLVWAPRVEREGYEVRILALTMPLGIGTY